jgi:hypothetical protein
MTNPFARPGFVEEFQRQIAAHEAEEMRRKAQQGLGNPIISIESNGYRLVAVGNQMRWGKNWKTVFDFLSDYIRSILGAEWGNAELKKPLEERHPILQWYDSLCRLQQRTILKPGEIYSVESTGATAAWYGLAYSLYLLAHNATLQTRLVARLKHPDQFRGAYYETLVAGWFILAGFELEVEDEGDSSDSHVEFIATSELTGKKFSVEAKARQQSKDHLDVGNQLFKALRKKAAHTRIVMIDVNVPHDDRRTQAEWLDEVNRAVKGREPKLMIDGQPAPPAYVIVTNHPYQYDLEATRTGIVVISAGFKIPGFGSLMPFPTYVEAYRAKQKHIDLFHLIKAIGNFTIPTTFNGEVPEFEFGQAERKWTIGERYDLDSQGSGTLMTASVAEERKEMMLAFRTDGNGLAMQQLAMTDAELAAYRRHPQTFFGIIQPVGSLNSEMDLFEWFLDSMKDATRAQHLEYFKNSPDLPRISELSDHDLLLERCQSMTLAVSIHSARTTQSAEAPPCPTSC